MKIFLLGSSGLVGSSVYSELLLQEKVPELTTFTRRRLNLMGGVEKVSDLKDFERDMEGLTAEIAFCAVGTTIKKAKSREAFEEIDLNLPLRFAVAARRHGVKNFHMLTALGADPSSKTYYLRIKGILESDLKALGFEGLHIYRPSLLLGERTESRLGEELMAGFYKRFQNLYPKALDKYRPIEVPALSRYIVRKIAENSKGLHIHENNEMLDG